MASHRQKTRQVRHAAALADKSNPSFVYSGKFGCKGGIHRKMEVDNSKGIWTDHLHSVSVRQFCDLSLQRLSSLILNLFKTGSNEDNPLHPFLFTFLKGLRHRFGRKDDNGQID